jgi:DNA-directed RNA polymerase subunit RPC12/RpoP
VASEVHCARCGKECPSPFVEPLLPDDHMFYLCADCGRSLFTAKIRRFFKWLRSLWN